MKKEIYLVRHGESLANSGLGGSADTGLSPLGHAQAGECATFLKAVCGPAPMLVSSPYLRCLTTAETISKAVGSEVHVEPALQEFFSTAFFKSARHPGLRTLSEIRMAHPRADVRYCQEEWWPGRHETTKDLASRMNIFSSRLSTNQFPSPTVICVAHWASIEYLIRAFCGNAEIKCVNNAGVSKIVLDGTAGKLEFVNNISFLSNATGNTPPY